MGPIFFVMAILGCGDGSTACEDARIVPVQYSSIAQCRAALPDEIARNTDVPFPVIGGECRRMGTAYAANVTGKPRG